MDSFLLHLGSAMRNLFLLLICFIAVHSESNPPRPPSVPIGPFADYTDPRVSPLGDDQENDFEGKKLFQGDIRNPGQISNGKVGEAGTRTPWPNGIIPYVFDCSVLSIESAVRATKDAMEEWQSRTCVKFVKKQPHHTVYVEFIRAAGCWATYVGFKNKKTQISIGNGCDYKHVMVHELGHVIGFWHEQSRPDRDRYITLDRGNVHRNLLYNFDIVKEQTNNYGEAYDFDSIMHYPWNAFAIDRRRNTIFPRDSRVLNSKRPYVKLSDSDVRQTNRMYGCSKIGSSRYKTMKKIGEASTKINVATLKAQCRDGHVHCVSWAKAEFCELSPDPMLSTCPKSCGVCDEPCVDGFRDCPGWADYGYCVSRVSRIKDFMLNHCKLSCSICTPATTTKPPTTTTTPPPTTTPKPATRQRVTRPPTIEQIITTPKSSTNKPVTRNGISTPTKKFTGVLCKDRSKYCKAWANDGRCDTDRWVFDNCMLSCKRFSICDREMIKPIGECTGALGVHSDKIIPDNRMSSSTTFSPGGGWFAPAASGRLYKEDDHQRKRVGAWCHAPYNREEKHLTIDFGRRRRIVALATQGRDTYFEHTKSYSLSFSDDRTQWREYREGGSKKIFDGNCDHVTPVLNILARTQYARFIRIHPIKLFGAACLRVEVYGC
ncbi:zinc metalloproteinase nas-13-like [Dendronephthya gigantea]|uniref:zinc metalloproteinase nas-13-like n=1 Tax=Dendronephthya gigantea TaxID=151771 RepID=UPI00106D31D5|nr:zinc metalloproteinase nas-13-like [Dendronephthya gigantea]